MRLLFSSKAEREQRTVVEKLVFFNPRQYRVREGIINSHDRFGRLHLHEDSTGLCLRVGDYETQNLFAYDQDHPKSGPVGVVVYLRTCPEEFLIIHVAVHPDYGLHGKHAGMGLGITLVEMVKKVAGQIVGVRRVSFFYQREVVVHLGDEGK